MKYLEIRSDLPDDDYVYGVIIYDEAKDEYIAELPDDLDYKDAPILLDSVIIKGSRTVGPFITGMWIRERIIPSNRQNLGAILKANKLDYYDEFKLLWLSNGRCAQDDFYLRPIPANSMPIDITKRLKLRIDDYVILPPSNVIIFFKNGETKLCDLSRLKYSWIKNVTGNERYFKSARLITCGYGLAWDDMRQISCEDLYNIGENLPFGKEAFLEFISQRTLGTTEVSKALDCTRQNILNLIKRDKLHPLKDLDNTKLFAKAEVDVRS